MSVTQSRKPLAFKRVGVTYEPTPWPGDIAHFGLIALDTDHVSESELHLLLPARDTRLFVTRVRHGGQCDLNHLGAMGDELARAASLLLPGTPLAAIAYGCTSGTVTIGFDRVRAAIQSERPGVPVTTPITAAHSALRELDVQRVAVLTPYIDEVNEVIVDYFDRAGITVTALSSFGLRSDIEMSSVPPGAIEAAVREMDLDEAQAVFVCCTALRSVGTIRALEQALQIPVIASNQAMVWDLMRLAGYLPPVSGYGQLLERSRRAEG